MSTLVVANEGELVLLGWTLRDTSVTDDIKLKLFRTDVTPSATSTVASFTEANFTDYTEKTLSRGSWGAPTTVSGKASSTYADQSWTAGSAQTIYGYYVTNDAEDTLLWAEKFDTARSLGIGDTLVITPKFTGNSES